MLKTGTLIDGKYKILNKIGGGGMGTVYLALNEKLNKTWAIKVAQRNGIHDNNTAIQGLVADKKTLIGLSHPNLPSIVDVYETDQSMMIVMDYIEGKPLSDSLAEYGAQPQEYIIKWAKQLCDVLGYLHSKNIIYRDMKPSNIMLKPDGNIILIDFGAAREFKEKNLADTQCLGTIGYAAPEQFGGHGQTDARTDVFCLGATLHHLITGVDPCQNPSFNKTPIRQINPSLSGGLERIIKKCLHDDKDQRYQSCAELMYALEHYEEFDGLFKKKQKKKLITFIITTFLSLLFTGTSVFGYVESENRLSADVELKIASAADVQLPQEERIALYLEAIRLKGADTRAYFSMLDMFLSSGETNGSLTREEASTLRQLEGGVNTQSNGYSTVFYPLEMLKEQNNTGYEEVCYEIGMAFWYDYEVESDRYSSAVEWLQKSLKSYPIANTYVAIGQRNQDIKKYAGQNRTEKMYEAYVQLWIDLNNLKDDAEKLDDNDTILLAWKEIIGNVIDKAGYFLVNEKKEDMIILLDNINDNAAKMKNKTQFNDIEKIIDNILLDISEAKIKINSVN